MREINVQTHDAPQRTWINEARLNDHSLPQKPSPDGIHYFLTTFRAARSSGHMRFNPRARVGGDLLQGGASRAGG